MQLEALALHEEDVSVLLARILAEERGLVGVGVELAALAFCRIELLQPVFFERSQQDLLRHFQPGVEVEEVFFVVGGGG